MRRASVIVIALLVSLLALQSGSTPSADAVMVSSSNVALVPGPCGAFSGAGCMPTSGFSGGYAPTFTNVATSNLPSVISNYDTVVLLQNCDIGTWLADNTWRDSLHNWINAGGKLIIYDSDACGTLTLDYSNFIYPFTTNNPCQCGSNQGTIEDVEDNTLSSTNPSSPYYVDLVDIQNNTDAVGDASVMLTQDSHWKGDLKAKNVNNFEGFTHTYAEYGSGLILYNGLDSDYLPGNAGLMKLWELELRQQWDPSDLPGGVPVSPVACSAPYAGSIASWKQKTNPSNVIAAIDQGFAHAWDSTSDSQTGRLGFRSFVLGGKEGINLLGQVDTKNPNRFLDTRHAMTCYAIPSFSGSAEITVRFKFRSGKNKLVAAAGSGAALDIIPDELLKLSLERYYTQATGKSIDQALARYEKFLDLFSIIVNLTTRIQVVKIQDDLFLEIGTGSDAPRTTKRIAEATGVFWSGPFSQAVDLSDKEFSVTATKLVTKDELITVIAGLETSTRTWGWAFGVHNFAAGLDVVDIRVTPTSP